MKEKVTVIISDDSDDEIRTLYSVNKDGVVLISDDDNGKNTPVQSSENTNVSVIENTRPSCSKEPSTSKENSSSTRKPSSPGRVNKRTHSPPSQDRQVFFEPATEQNVTKSPNMKMTIKGSTSNNANDKAIYTAQHSLCMPMSKPTSRNNSHSFDRNENKTERSHSSDSKKGNLPARNVDVRHSSRTPNKDARSSRERIRTRSTSYGASEKTGRETSPRDKCKGDVNSAKNRNNQGDSCSTSDRRQTNSAPSSGKNTGDHSSESSRRNKTDSNVKNANCGKNTKNCSSRCSDSCSTNDRRQTNSAPSSSKNTGDHNAELDRRNKTYSNVRNANSAKNNNSCSSRCSNSSSTNDRRRTNSDPSSSKNTGHHNSQLGRKNKTDSNVRNANCGKDTKNCSSQCSDLCSANDRRRTNSAPSSSKNTVENNSELGRRSKTDSNVRNANCAKNTKNCSSTNPRPISRPTNDRRRTNSAPCGSNTTRDHNSEFGDKTDSNMTTGSCSTQVNGKRKRTAPSNSMDTEQNKRQCIRPGTAPASSNPQTSAVSSSVTLPANSQNLSLPSLENLSTFSHIIFIDLDNWGKFFKISYPLPPKIFVWGFCGGNYTDMKKISGNFRALLREKRFFQHPKCGRFKNAADFALCVQAARMDLQLPIHIPFTVLSGDKGFCELQNQLRCSARKMYIVDPHSEDPDILQGIIASIGDT